jgi:hypothetical protein
VVERVSARIVRRATVCGGRFLGRGTLVSRVQREGDVSNPQVKWSRQTRRLVLDSCSAQRFRSRRFVGSGTLVSSLFGDGGRGAKVVCRVAVGDVSHSQKNEPVGRGDEQTKGAVHRGRAHAGRRDVGRGT